MCCVVCCVWVFGVVWLWVVCVSGVCREWGWWCDSVAGVHRGVREGSGLVFPLLGQSHWIEFTG